MGTTTAITFRPKASRSALTVASYAAFSRSIRLTTMRQGRPAAVIISQASSAPTGTEPWALTTRTAASAPARALATSPAKSWKPGASMRVTWVSFQSQWATAELMEMERRCSSGSKSKIEVPWSVEPNRGVAPAVCRSASHRVVLPSWLWPTTATVRMRSGAGVGMA